jgi:isopentenyl-diphosphate Delta-isomerase
MKRIIIVNDKDEPIGNKEFDSVLTGDYYRVAALFIFNSQNELLIVQRAFTKKLHPGGWGPSVAGTLEVGETYDTNIVKETEEEIGVTGLDIYKAQKLLIEFNDRKYFAQIYAARSDLDISDLVLQKEEVEQAKWMKLTELSQDVKNHPENYTPTFSKIISNSTDVKKLEALIK